MTFAEQLYRFRRDKGLTLRDLAGQVGVSLSYISDMEHGRRGIPGDDLIEKLEACLEIKDSSLKVLAHDQQEVRQTFTRKLQAMPSTQMVALMRVISTMSEDELSGFIAGSPKEK